MNRILTCLALAGLIGVGAGIGVWAQSESSAGRFVGNREQTDGPSRRLASVASFAVKDLDGMRSVTFDVQGDGDQFLFNIPPGSDIDVGTIIVSNGRWSDLNAARFGMWIEDSNLVRWTSVSSNEFGVTSVTFPKPLKIRAGVHSLYGYCGPLEGEGLSFVEVTLIGTAPAGVVDSLSVR